MLPSGIGKSRIIPTLGLILLFLGLANRIHIVIPNESLLRRDKNEYQDYWKMSNLSNKVEYHSNAKFKPKSNSVVIVDEADELIFGDPLTFDKLLTHGQIIGLTATVPDVDLNPLEN